MRGIPAEQKIHTKHAKKLSSLSRGLENHPTPIKYSFISLKVQGDIPFHFLQKEKGEQLISIGVIRDFSLIRSKDVFH